MEISKEEVYLISEKADKLLLLKDTQGLKRFLNEITSFEFQFESPFDEAQFYYNLGNCYSAIHHPSISKWYSPEQTKVVVSYRKALLKIDELEADLITNRLKAMICTNLANHLSSQGRSLCCIELYDQAIALVNNPVAYIGKARNEIFIAESIFDPGHQDYHYHIAATLLNEVKPLEKYLEEEQRIPINKDGYLHDFKCWYDNSYQESDFKYFEVFKESFKSIEQENYLRFCGDNKLFLNDLSDVCTYEITYQDILALPSLSLEVNDFLLECEELIYHGNYDEIKNDYCYARYLVFSGSQIEDNETHFFNETYPHVDTSMNSIENLKVSHYKSAFKSLYSLFDKIAYFINRYFRLNNISKDSQINIDKLFRKLGTKDWKPNPNLEDGNNFFLNALYFILKDIRKVAEHDSVFKWVDPKSKTFSDIRNAIEHRSLVIVNSNMYNTMKQKNKNIQEKINQQQNNFESELQSLAKAKHEARILRDTEQEKLVQYKLNKLNKEFDKFKEYRDEKLKLSTHTLYLPVEEFERQLLMLLKLVRNSVMYLSFAINLDRKLKNEDNNGPVYFKDVPLKR